MLVGAALFGISGVVARGLFQGQKSLPPLVLVDVRVTLTFLALLLIVGLTNRRRLHVPKGQRIPLLLWGAVPFLLVQYTYFVAISATNVATAIFLEYLSPRFGALYARVILRQRLGPSLMAGVLLAVGGAGLLVFGGGAGVRVSPLGLGAGIASAVALAWYGIWSGRLARGQVNPWAQLVWGMGAAALVAQVVTPPWVLAAHLAQRELWGFYLYLVILGTAVPFALFIHGLRSLPPTVALILATVEPMVAALAAWLYLGESLAAVQVAGTLGIIAAVLTVQLSAARAQAGGPQVSRSKTAP